MKFQILYANSVLWYEVVQFNKMYQQRMSNNFNNNFNKLMKAYAVSPTSIDTMCVEMYVGKYWEKEEQDEKEMRKQDKDRIK